MSNENYGKYQLLKRLAMGGMAQIYLARQRGPEGFEKLLVIKRILPHLAENGDFVRMFLDEARIAARLDHPNIVDIYDLGAQDDTFFIAMEYIHGEDLRRVWKRAERSGQLIPVPLVCRIMIEACAGLDHAHKQKDAQGKPLGIVHRDISPQNILLTFEGRVKVVDFGIAKAADQATVTRSGVLKGKYSYMSPEQAAGNKSLDRRTDIFALGVVLYELLTGMRLFKRLTDMATLQAVADCEIQPPSQINPRVPKDLDPIVMKALTREPEDRYAEALQLQLALEDWLRAHQLPSSTAHVAAFMKELYAARLAEEARLGDVLVVDDAESASPAGAGKTSEKSSEKSSAETMAAPRQPGTQVPLPERPSLRTPRLKDARGTSERKAVEPRRTVDIRRASAPELAEEPRSYAPEKSTRRRTPPPEPGDESISEASDPEKTLAPKSSRSRQPAVQPPPQEPQEPRKPYRVALLAVGVGLIVGVGLGGWFALHSERAPVAVAPVTKPAPPEPSPSVPEQPAPPREEPKPVVAATPPTPTPSPRVEQKPEPERPTPGPVERVASQESRRGTVRFAVTPWAEVSCGGRNLGTTPLPDVSLTVGEYECKFSNPEFGTRTQRVEVKANSHTKVVVKF
ncbi:serine/threonine-protein kinase [Archangium violaceum]|uniref:serine/threonine protein kinase n=1 Tax=Archangium violaceum TaxID=83451 RepID=UPI002B291217|nr:serine/threonine-protein kinase [Archangium gephyra]